MQQRTNCNNCGGVLVDGKCPYCKAVWFKPGFQLGKNAYVTQAEFTMHQDLLDARDLSGRMSLVRGAMEYEVSLTIVGLTPNEVRELFDTIRGKWS